MTTPAWVVGSGGLLGSAVLRGVALRDDFSSWTPPEGRFSWGDAPTLEAELTRATRAFVRDVMNRQLRRWAVLWCAGVGVVGTTPAALQAESLAWERFLAGLASVLSSEGASGLDGIVMLASSAGGLHAGGGEGPFTERSLPRPRSAYGEAKLRQERALDQWATRHPRISTLVPRISNLYGPGQNLGKPQGLISHMSRSIIHARPVHIYVPLDTVRDYLFAEDAGVGIARWVGRLGREAAHASAGRRVLKICASERDTTIASLVGIFRRLGRRQVKIVSGVHQSHALQPRRLRFRSRVWTDEPPLARVSLHEGVGRLHQHQVALFQAGRLPPPSLQLPLATSQIPRTNP